MNTGHKPPPEKTKFHLIPAILRSLRWGLVGSLLLVLMSFVPGLNVLPFGALMAAYVLLARFHVLGVPSEAWAVVVVVCLFTFVFALFRLVHLYFLHQLANSPDHNA